MSLADNIKARMAELKTNPYRTAKAAGLGDDFVRDILRGRVREPSHAKLKSLADALDTTVDALMDEVAPKPSMTSEQMRLGRLKVYKRELMAEIERRRRQHEPAVPSRDDAEYVIWTQGRQAELELKAQLARDLEWAIEALDGWIYGAKQ